MTCREPEHVAPIVKRVLADIARQWERRHGKPVPERVRKLIDADDETNDIDLYRRGRDPPVEVTNDRS